MKKWVRYFLLVLLMVFIIYTGYAYKRHQYQVTHINVDRYIEMTEFDIYIMEIKGYGEEIHGDRGPSSLIRWAYESDIPDWLRDNVIRTVVFYSEPYRQYDEKSDMRSYEVHTIILPHEENYDYFDKDTRHLIRMEIQSDDHRDTRASTGGGGTKMDDSNFYQAHYRIGWPYEVPNHLEVTDLISEEVTLIDLEAAVTETYGFFHRDYGVGRAASMADVAISMSMGYSYGGKDSVRELIHEDYLEDFDWTYLEGLDQMDFEKATVKHIGVHDGYDHGFTVEITDNNRDLIFYTVYDQGQWMILGVK